MPIMYKATAEDYVLDRAFWTAEQAQAEAEAYLRLGTAIQEGVVFNKIEEQRRKNGLSRAVLYDGAHTLWIDQIVSPVAPYPEMSLWFWEQPWGDRDLDPVGVLTVEHALTIALAVRSVEDQEHPLVAVWDRVRVRSAEYGMDRYAEVPVHRGDGELQTRDLWPAAYSLLVADHPA